eukprot:5237809-Pyramimonas_sp.AAC.1
MWISPDRRAHSIQIVARASKTEGESFSRCGSRLRAAHIRFKDVQELRGLRAASCQHVVLAFAPRTFVINTCKRFADSH